MADKKLRSQHGSDRTPFPHLNPLSQYSRAIFCEVASSSPASTDRPFCNLKIELVNNSMSGSRKRRLDDSCLDETYETPFKKPRAATCQSPDLACVLDSFNTLEEQKSVPLESPSRPHNKSCKIKTAGANLNIHAPHPVAEPSYRAGLVYGDCSDTKSCASLNKVQSAGHPTAVEKDSTAVSTVFNFDMDEIMCLSPIDYESGSDLDEFILNCQTFYKEQQYADDHSSKQDGGQSEVQAGENAAVESQIIIADEGYFTKCAKTTMPVQSKNRAKDDEDFDLQSSAAKHRTPPSSPITAPIMSTPLVKLRAQSPFSKLRLSPKEVMASPILHQKPESFHSKELITIPVLDNSSKEEVVISGCTSLFESQKKNDEPDVLSVSQQEAKSGFQESLWNTIDATNSFESTLLQVQVKSKVVLPNNQEVNTKPTIKAENSKSSAVICMPKSNCGVPRPLVFPNEEHWEREKKAYVNSVMRHMEDNAKDGVISELVHLMDDVANQGPENNGKQWKHPSDLTHRNYQPKNRNGLLSLDEWQKLNGQKIRRFVQVPPMFKRSPVV